MQRLLLPRHRGRRLLDATINRALALGLEEGAPDTVLVRLGGAGGAVEQDGEAREGGGARASFTDEELLWGRKEAKSRLSAEEFREWRKAAKKASKAP